MDRNEFTDRCVEFSIKINRLRKEIQEKKHEYNNSDQVQRSGTSIGANYCEACHAESKADFIHKMGIALKEANETMYWLELLKETEYISDEQFNSLYADAEEVMRMLTRSILSARKRVKK